ncbi:hypothetical protein L0244_27445, partial [bacterium]|nr:hypothetical protein [bacterium]
SIWVLVLGNDRRDMFPNEWRVRQRIQVMRKSKQAAKRPYLFIGDPEKSETFDILKQLDATSTLHSLEFANGKKIPTSIRGAKIGRHFQSLRPLTELDAQKLRSHVTTQDSLQSLISVFQKTFESVTLFQKEDAYVRIMKSAEQQVIIPKHKILANKFRRWLEGKGFKVRPESENIDIQFTKGSKRGIAELKICALGTKYAIRDALGQLLEYSLYPNRIFPEVLLIVLDNAPSKTELEFVEILRGKFELPLLVGWCDSSDFINLDFLDSYFAEIIHD